MVHHFTRSSNDGQNWHLLHFLAPISSSSVRFCFTNPQCFSALWDAQGSLGTCALSCNHDSVAEGQGSQGKCDDCEDSKLPNLGTGNNENNVCIDSSKVEAIVEICQGPVICSPLYTVVVTQLPHSTLDLF